MASSAPIPTPAGTTPRPPTAATRWCGRVRCGSGRMGCCGCWTRAARRGPRRAQVRRLRPGDQRAAAQQSARRRRFNRVVLRRLPVQRTKRLFHRHRPWRDRGPQSRHWRPAEDARRRSLHQGHPADDRGGQGAAAGAWPRATSSTSTCWRSRPTGAGCTTSRRPDRCRASRRGGSTIPRPATPNGASTSSSGPTPRPQAAPRSMPRATSTPATPTRCSS